MKKREAELALPGALDAIINKSDVNIAGIIERYLSEYDAIRQPWSYKGSNANSYIKNLYRRALCRRADIAEDY